MAPQAAEEECGDEDDGEFEFEVEVGDDGVLVAEIVGEEEGVDCVGGWVGGCGE